MKTPVSDTAMSFSISEPKRDGPALDWRLGLGCPEAWPVQK